MKKTILAAALAALVLSGCAHYSGAELARGTESHVVIDARLGVSGELEDVRITGEGTDAEEFVAAVRGALKEHIRVRVRGQDGVVNTRV